MSLWSEYKKEISAVQFLEYEHGFISYSISNDYVYIEDIFVIPEKRRSNLAKEMADFVVQIGKSKGCTKLFGSIETKIKDPHRSLQVLLSYGMKLHSAVGSIVYFVKEI